MLNMKKLTTKLLNAVKTDYIVEQGTSGIWAYRKWNSGIAECWAKMTSNDSLAAGTHKAFSTPLPTFLINSTPFVITSGGGSAQPRCFALYSNVYGSSGAYGTETYVRNEGGSACASQWAYFYVKGTWK